MDWIYGMAYEGEEGVFCRVLKLPVWVLDYVTKIRHRRTIKFGEVKGLSCFPCKFEFPAKSGMDWR